MGLGKPQPKKKRVYLGIAQITIWPPLVRKSGHFVAQIFCRKWENSLNSNFDFGNEYFDSDQGHRWFWDGILMEIKVNIGEIDEN